jgi:hypothetical protein
MCECVYVYVRVCGGRGQGKGFVRKLLHLCVGLLRKVLVSDVDTYVNIRILLDSIFNTLPTFISHLKMQTDYHRTFLLPGCLDTVRLILVLIADGP